MLRRFCFLAARLGAVVLLALLLMQGTALAEEAIMTDAEAIAILRTYKIVRGDPSGALLLDEKLTRAQAAAIFIRSRGSEGLAEMLREVVPFADSKGHWAAGEIALAERLGLMKGDGNGNFRPNDEITYAEVLTVLLRMLEQEPAGPWHPVTIMEASRRIGIAASETEATAPAIRGKIFWSLAMAVGQVQTPEGRTVLQKHFDQMPPQLELDSPGAVTKSETISISGTAPDALRVIIGGRTVPVLAATGRFQATVPLRLGQNRIEVVAVDHAGNRTESSVSMERKPDIARIEIVGPAVVRANTSAKLTIAAFDPRGSQVPLDGVTAEVSDAMAVFDMARQTITYGSKTGVGTLTLKTDEVSAAYSFHVTEQSPDVVRLSIMPVNNGIPPAVGQEVLVEVRAHDSKGQLVASDYWRTIFLTADGPAAATVSTPMGTTEQGRVTFKVRATRDGMAYLKASSPGIAEASTALQVLTATRVVLKAVPESIPPDFASTAAVRAYLQDQFGRAVVNDSATDMIIEVAAAGTDGAMTRTQAVIRRGRSDSEGYDAQYRSGIAPARVVFSGEIKTGQHHSLLQGTLSPAPLPGTKLQFDYPTAAQVPGQPVTIGVRVLDAQGQLVTTGSYSFQLSVSAGNGENRVKGMPEGVQLTFDQTAFRPVDDGIGTGDPTNDVYAVVGRTHQGRASLTLTYNKSGTVSLTPVPTGAAYDAYHPTGGQAPAAASAGMAMQPFAVSFAGQPAQVRLTVDSAAFGQNQATAMTGTNASVTLRALVLDAAGVPIPGYSGAISVTRKSGNGVTTIYGGAQKNASNSVAEFGVSPTGSTGYDVYAARLGNLPESQSVTIYVRSTAPATPVIAAVRGSKDGTLLANGYVGPEATHMDIQLQPQASPVSGQTQYPVIARVFRRGEAAPIYSAVVDMMADPPIVRVPKSALTQGRFVYEVSVHNGYSESARSADLGQSTAVNVAFHDSFKINSAHYDAASGVLTLHTGGLAAGGTVAKERLRMARDTHVVHLSDPTASVISVAPNAVVISLGTSASAVSPDLFNGPVVIQADDAWYTHPDGGWVARASAQALVRPMAVITHATFDGPSRRLYLHGTGFTHGTLDLNKVRVEQGDQQVPLRIGTAASNDKVAAVNDSLITVDLAQETVNAINSLQGANPRVAADLGWLKLAADGRIYHAGAVAGAGHGLFVKGTVTSAEYVRWSATLILRGTGFSGAALDPAKLTFRASGTQVVWSPTTASKAFVLSDGTIEIRLNGDAGAFHSNFGGKTVFLNTNQQWLVDAQGRAAAPIPLNSILLSVSAQ